VSVQVRLLVALVWRQVTSSPGAPTNDLSKSIARWAQKDRKAIWLLQETCVAHMMEPLMRRPIRRLNFSPYFRSVGQPAPFKNESFSSASGEVSGQAGRPVLVPENTQDTAGDLEALLGVNCVERDQHLDESCLNNGTSVVNVVAK
jgi:hypothetical protein